MPTMPSYEAGTRGLEDQNAASKRSIESQLAQVQPQYNLQMARYGTDEGYANNQLDESLADRGMWGSSVNPYLRQRDIQIPYGRARQDLAQWAGQSTADLNLALEQAALGYNQGLNELLLTNAANAAAYAPISSAVRKPPRKKKGGKKGGNNGKQK